MANVLRRPTRWTRQPLDRLAVDWSAPLASGLKFVYTRDRLLTPAGSFLPASIWSSNAGLQSTPYGVGYRLGGNAADYVRFDNTYSPTSNEAFTLEIYVIASSYPSLGGTAGLATTSVTNGSYNGTAGQTRAVLSFNGTDPCNIYFLATGGNDFDSLTPFEANKIQHVFVVWDPARSNAIEIYRGGKLLRSTSGAAPLSTSGPYFYLGGGYAGRAGTPNGVVVKAGFYNRALSVYEILALTRSPWQVFEPIRRAVFFAGGGTPTGTAAAVGGATTKAAGVGNTVGSGKAVGGATTKAAGVGVTVGTAAAVGGATTKAAGVGVTVGTAAARGGGAAKATGSGSSIGTGTAAAVAGGSAKAAGASAKLGAGKAVAGGAAKAAGAATHSGTAAAVGGAAAKAVGAAPLPPSEVDHYIQGWPVNAAGAVIVHVVP